MSLFIVPPIFFHTLLIPKLLQRRSTVAYRIVNVQMVGTSTQIFHSPWICATGIVLTRFFIVTWYLCDAFHLYRYSYCSRHLQKRAYNLDDRPTRRCTSIVYAPMWQGPQVGRGSVEDVSVTDLSRVDDPHTIYVSSLTCAHRPPCLFTLTGVMLILTIPSNQAKKFLSSVASRSFDDGIIRFQVNRLLAVVATDSDIPEAG
jgi:hypothetical protein